MAGEHGNPNGPLRPGDTLSTSDIISNIQSEQQKIKEKKELEATKAKQQKELSNVVQNLDYYTSLRKQKYVELANYEKTLKNLYIEFGNPPYSPAETDALNNAIYYVTTTRQYIDTLTTKITDYDNQRKTIQNKLITASTAAAKKEFDSKNQNKPGSTKGSNPGKNVKPAGTNPTPEPPPPRVPLYTYNAPMVRTAYFRGRGPQSQTTDSSISDAGNYTDAQNMYTPTVYDPVTGAVVSAAPAAKGTFQMYRRLQDNTQFYQKSENADKDPTMYGFKFLYNPTEVSMGWGIAEGFNPEVVQSGADGGIGPIGAGVDQSTIDFTLLLNRVEDMQYLNSNGFKPDVKSPYPGDFNKVEDLQIIYKKGTMYDIEYLFRTINGPNAIYQSGLNDKTADRGYLTGARVELHLGDGLRYLVRLGSLTINHTMFNERMVPLLSNVQISCHRFYDIPAPGDR